MVSRQWGDSTGVSAVRARTDGAVTPRRAARRQRRRRLGVVAGCGLLGVAAVVGVGLGVAGGSSSSGKRALPAPSSTSTSAPSTTTSTTATTAPPPPPAIPPVIANGRRDQRTVALTFDSNLTDAMIQELNSGKVASFANVAVIDELDQLQVPATMFLAGKWIERYPDLTRRLATDPLLELGSHSYSHRAFHRPCYGLGSLPVNEMADDVAHSEALLRQYTASPTPYFRFPGGCFDEAALRAIAPTAVTVIQYDLASGDAFGTSVRAIVNNTVNNVQNGSIVVMHITGGNTAPLTAQALPFIVSGLRQRGFQLVRLSDMLRPTVAP
jgi:peptidoglycan/xylan/chitin deacetylase (PgdA/CDA1 family)